MSTDNRQITTVVSQQQEEGVWGFQPCRGQEKKKEIDSIDVLKNNNKNKSPLDQVNNNQQVKTELQEGVRVMCH